MEKIDARVAVLEQRVKDLEAQLRGPAFGGVAAARAGY